MKTLGVLFFTIAALLYYFSRTTVNARPISNSKQNLLIPVSAPVSVPVSAPVAVKPRDAVTQAVNPKVQAAVVKPAVDLNADQRQAELEAQERYENPEKDADFLAIRRRDDEEKSLHELQHAGIN